MTQLDRITQSKIEDAWFGIEFNDAFLPSPFRRIPEQFEDNPQHWIMYNLAKPEYFGLLCKEILNVELHPFQSAILGELWGRRFPMLVGSRGMSKCVSDSTWIVTSNGICQISDIIPYGMENFKRYKIDVEILGETGFKQPEYVWSNGVTETRKIRTSCGYSLEGTLNHPIRVKSGDDVVWKNLEDLVVGDIALIDIGLEAGRTDKKALVRDFRSMCGVGHNLPPYNFSSPIPSILFNLQFILTRFGIVSRLEGDTLSIHDDYIERFNRVLDYEDVEIENSIFYDEIVSIEVSATTTYDFYFKDDHSFISNGFISHNSFLLAIYAWLRLLLIPGRKIVVAGAAFRQSKLIFEYMEQIYNNAPILRSCLSQVDSISHAPEMWTIKVGTGFLHAIPVGTGETIRGLRAHDIICVSKDTLVQTDRGLIKIQDFADGREKSLLTRDGSFEYPSNMIKTRPTDVYEITTRGGLSLKCSGTHRVMTTEGWKFAKDLTAEDYVEISTNDYFPEEYVEVDGLELSDDIGWLMGLLMSEGDISSRNSFSIYNTDIELIDKIKKRLNFKWNQHYRKSYTNKRGCYHLYCCDTELRGKIQKLGLDYCVSRDKEIPWSILQSPKSVVVEFLRGLFEGDGTAFQITPSGGTKKKSIGLAYYSVSYELCRVLQIILTKFGIIGALNKRKSKFSDRDQWSLSFRGESATNLYNLLRIEKWGDMTHETKFYKDKKVLIHKNYNKLVATTSRNNKNIYLGSFDTEVECSKAFDDYWSQAPLTIKVKSVKRLEQQESLYDFHLPINHNFVTNSFISHNCDEFKSHNKDVLENVIFGFAVTRSSPVEANKRLAEIAKMRELKLDTSHLEDKDELGNQIIISGTAYYDFNHFAHYWKTWKRIITTRGEKAAFAQVFGNDAPEFLNWRDFSIIRIPYELLPRGFMDDQIIARAKVSMHSGNFQVEFQSVFSKDSQGFFKRSLIEGCCTSPESPVIVGNDEVWFDAKMYGDKDLSYVIGIDPASERDNFAIVVLEVHPTHRRIVHVWTTNQREQMARLKAGLTKEADYFSYCSRKIRELMKRFNVKRIVIDAGGGGREICNTLRDKDKIVDGEYPLWPTINPMKPKDEDVQEGLHIIDIIDFSRYDWIAAANQNLRLDFEQKKLLFPYFNAVQLALAAEQDSPNSTLNENGQFLQLFDTFEGCLLNIEELKDELASIIVTRTATGRERWDVPETKGEGKTKGHQKKDRYSALLIANGIARDLYTEGLSSSYRPDSMYSGEHQPVKNAYTGPDWFTHNLQDVFDLYG